MPLFRDYEFIHDPDVHFRFFYAIDYLGLSPNTIEKDTNISKDVLEAMWTGVESIGLDVLDWLTTQYGISSTWMLTGQGSMTKQHSFLYRHLLERTSYMPVDKQNVLSEESITRKIEDLNRLICHELKSLRDTLSDKMNLKVDAQEIEKEQLHLIELRTNFLTARPLDENEIPYIWKKLTKFEATLIEKRKQYHQILFPKQVQTSDPKVRHIQTA